MRFVVIGAGSIGERHCRNLVSLGHEVLVWDTDSARLHAVDGVARAASSLDAALAATPHAVLICTPPVSHVELARRALQAGAHVFVEKPIAHTSDAVDAVLDLARARGRLLTVGYNLRFLSSLRRLKAMLDEERIGKVLAVRSEFGSYLPDWRPGRDYRTNYAVRAALGGGILLDAIHEFDYLGWFFGDVAEVFCAAAHVSDLAGDSEDLTDTTLRFASGLLGQVHLDYLQRVYRRNVQVIGEAGTLIWDYPTHTIAVYRPESPPDIVRIDDGDANQMYLDEMRHFVRCVEGHESPLVDGREALRSLRLVEAAKLSAREGRWVKL